jgi:hypothetical protein
MSSSLSTVHTLSERPNDRIFFAITGSARNSLIPGPMEELDENRA